MAESRSGLVAMTRRVSWLEIAVALVVYVAYLALGGGRDDEAREYWTNQ